MTEQRQLERAAAEALAAWEAEPGNLELWSKAMLAEQARYGEAERGEREFLMRVREKLLAEKK